MSYRKEPLLVYYGARLGGLCVVMVSGIKLAITFLAVVTTIHEPKLNASQSKK